MVRRLALLAALAGVGCTGREAGTQKSAPPPALTPASAAAPTAAAPDASGTAQCLPAASCQCFRGECLLVQPTEPHQGRVVGGARHGQTVRVIRTCPRDDKWNQLSACLDWIEEMNACTGACVLTDPGYRCGVVDGTCRKL